MLKINGLWKAKGFYPKHDFETPDSKEISFGLEDNRNTLLWLPRTTTDENGELKIEFYTSDISSIFSLVCVSYGGNCCSVGETKINFIVQ